MPEQKLLGQLEDLARAFVRLSEAMSEFVMALDAALSQVGGDASATGTGDPLGPIYGLAERTYEQTLASIDEALT